MSRLTEALRRMKPEQTEDDAASEVPRQHLFKPAWSVSADQAEAEPTETLAAEPPARAPLLSTTTAPPDVIRFSSRWRERLAAGPDADPALTEQFRRLAATLHHAQQTHNLRSVMVTSASPGDGKTLTAINLALILAESYRYNVLLLDADLRRPSITNVVEINGGSGLSEALRAGSETKLALVRITQRLTLLPAGQPVANSIEALTSPRMKLLLDEATSRFDWVIMDAPPVGPVTDARLLTQMAGGTLFVIHAGQTQYADVRKAIDALGRDQILGVVLNGVEEGSSETYQYYGEPQGRAKA